MVISNLLNNPGREVVDLHLDILITSPLYIIRNSLTRLTPTPMNLAILGSP